MFRAYDLARSLTESANGGFFVDNIQPYVFRGSLEEAAAEFDFNLISEQANLVAFKTSADEIITEAAINNPNSLDVLSENVFETIGNKVKAIIDKIIAMVKGIIDKLKAFYFKFTKKTDSWLNIMRPKITLASGKQGASDFEVEVHKWDIPYITEGMIGGVDKCMVIAAKAGDGTFEFVSSMTGTLSAVKGFVSADMKDMKGDDESVKKAIEALEKKTEEFKKNETDNEDTYSDIADAMDVAGSDSSMDDIWNAVTKKATGGEKVTMKVSECAGGKFGSGVDGMMKAIAESKKTIQNLQKSYDKHLKDLKSMRSKADAAFKKDSKIENLDKYPSELKAKYQSAISALSSQFSSEITLAESAVNNARAKNTSFLQTMTSEYMTILSKFAGYKGKKEDK